MSDSICIVGGGAGGIFAALAARRKIAELGAAPIEVHLFERNPRIGIKILISGGGKCNITHAGPVAELLKEGFRPKKEQHFLRSALYRYTNEDVIALLARRNVTVHARENGRVFPDSARAGDVLTAFEQELEAESVMLHTASPVEAIERTPDGWKLTVRGKQLLARALILATGGMSYSKTGTTGDGIRYAQALGHTIVPVRAALAPIYLRQTPHESLVGIALRNAEIFIIKEGKAVASEHGDMLITHRGLSGPAVLGISNRAAIQMETGSISVEVNLLGQPEDILGERLVAEARTRPQQQVSTWLEEVLPNRFVPIVIAQAEVPGDRRWNALRREERIRLATTLARFSFGPVAEVPIERGEVTSGGVELSEVDPKTMMSRIHPGLFFAGEMLDVAGEIGGYNLQAAYSTGWVAGEEAINFLGKR